MARAGLQPLDLDQCVVVTLDREGLGRALEPARPHGDRARCVGLDPDGCPTISTLRRIGPRTRQGVGPVDLLVGDQCPAAGAASHLAVAGVCD